MKIAVQLIAYALFAGLVGYFTSQPPLRLLQSDEALLSVSFTHAAQRVGACVRLSQEELLALPPNMRKPDNCPRERHPLYLEIVIDGEMLYRGTLQPSGLWHDGKASIYQRFRITSGDHRITARMNDSGGTTVFDFESSANLHVEPGQNVVIFFDASSQLFAFQ